MIRGPEMEVVSLHPLRGAPFAYCFFCRKLMKKHEQVSTISIPTPYRYGKQRKKLARTGLLFRTHMAHADCPMMRG